MSNWPGNRQCQYSDQFCQDCKYQQGYQENLIPEYQETSLLGLKYDPIQMNQPEDIMADIDFDYDSQYHTTQHKQQKLERNHQGHQIFIDNKRLRIQPKIYRDLYSLIFHEEKIMDLEMQENYIKVGQGFIELLFKELIHLQYNKQYRAYIPICFNRGRILTAFLLLKFYQTNGVKLNNQEIQELNKRLLLNVGIKHSKRMINLYEEQIKSLVVETVILNQNKEQLLQIQDNLIHSVQVQTQTVQFIVKKQYSKFTTDICQNAANISPTSREIDQIQLKRPENSCSKSEDSYSKSVVQQVNSNYYTQARKQFDPYNDINNLKYHQQQQLIYQKWIQYVKSQQQEKKQSMALQNYQANFQQTIFQNSQSPNAQNFDSISFLSFQKSCANLNAINTSSIKLTDSYDSQSLILKDQTSLFSMTNIMSPNSPNIQRKESDQDKAKVQKYLQGIRSFKAEINMLSQQMEIPYVVYNRKMQNKKFCIQAQLKFQCKYLNNSQVEFIARAEDMNLNKAKAICAQKILRQIYYKIPELWKDYRKKKQAKGIDL